MDIFSFFFTFVLTDPFEEIVKLDRGKKVNVNKNLTSKQLLVKSNYSVFLLNKRLKYMKKKRNISRESTGYSCLFFCV